MTFLKWLDSRYGTESNQLGQLADAVKTNPEYPKRARSYKTIKKHIRDVGLYHVLNVAYSKYRRSEEQRS